MHKKHTLKVLYNFCINKKLQTKYGYGASFEAFTYEKETLEHFVEKSSGELKYSLQQMGLPVGGFNISLAARTLIAFEQKKPITTTADNLVKKLSEDYVNLLK